MKTIANIIHHKNFPLMIIDIDGKEVYYEDVNKYWQKREYDSNGHLSYYEDLLGCIEDDR